MKEHWITFTRIDIFYSSCWLIIGYLKSGSKNRVLIITSVFRPFPSYILYKISRADLWRGDSHEAKKASPNMFSLRINDAADVLKSFMRYSMTVYQCENFHIYSKVLNIYWLKMSQLSLMIPLSPKKAE